jgi:hypothetical protein
MSTPGKLSIFNEVADFQTQTDTPVRIMSIERAQNFAPSLKSRGSTGRMISEFVVESRRVSKAHGGSAFFKTLPGDSISGGVGGHWGRRASFLKTKVTQSPRKHHHNLSPCKGSSVDMVGETPTFTRTVFNPKTKLEGTITGAFVDKHTMPKPNYRVRPSFSAPG